MNVVYFAVGQEHAAMAELAATALRATNPAATAWVLTDPDTQFQTLQPVRGYVSAQTLIYDRTIAQYHFLVQQREALFLDSDCVVNRDLTGAFDGSIAVTKRIPPKEAANQPYNGGVLYGRGHGGVAFWMHWCQLYWHIQRDAWAWYGDQAILPHLVKDYPVTVYDGSTHNYVPTSAEDALELKDAYIVHFKGPRRKAFMADYVRKVCDATQIHCA